MTEAHKTLTELFADRKAHEIAIEIYGFTGFRTGFIEELTDAEATKLLAMHLPKEKDLDEEFNALKYDMICREWKHKIIDIATSEGIKKEGWHDFNNFMQISSVFKKHLNAHNLEELKVLFKQFKAIQTNNRKSARKTMTKAWERQGYNIKHLN